MVESIPGISGYPHSERDKLYPSQDNPGMVGVSQESQNTQTEGSERCPSQDVPGMVRVSWESQDTPIGGRGASCVHPRMILRWSEYPWNPRILRWGGGGVSFVHPRMILGWSAYPGNPRILRWGGDKLDDPGMVEVSQDIEVNVSYVHPGMILGWSKYLRNTRILRQRGELCSSQNNLGTVEVSQESQDTDIGGGGKFCPSQGDPQMVRVSLES